MPATYPSRPNYFAHRFLRVLNKACAVQEIGQGAMCLLMAVAITEDAKRYTGAVTFFNDQLLPITGFRSWDALAKARDRAIEEGWLHYEPGGKYVAGRYWVMIPERLEVLNDAPMGEVDAVSIRPGADGSLIETGSKPAPSALNPRHSGLRADCERIESGSTPEHSILLPIPIPFPKTNATAAPVIDDAEQDITAPGSVHVPRGTESPRTTATADDLHGLGVWVRCRVSDQARTAENRATILALVERYGPALVQRAAEALTLRGDASRERAPGRQCWPDELLPELVRMTSAAQPPPAAVELPPVVTAAQALVALHGSAAARSALGWSPTTAPTTAGLLRALEREALAQDLVDAFAHGPLVVVEH